MLTGAKRGLVSFSHPFYKSKDHSMSSTKRCLSGKQCPVRLDSIQTGPDKVPACHVSRKCLASKKTKRLCVRIINRHFIRTCCWVTDVEKLDISLRRLTSRWSRLIERVAQNSLYLTCTARTPHGMALYQNRLARAQSRCPLCHETRVIETGRTWNG